MSLDYHTAQRIAALRAEGYSHARLDQLVAYLELREYLGAMSIEALEIFADGRHYVLSNIAAAMAHTCPGHCDLPLILAAIHRLNPRPATGAGKGNAPSLSIPLADVPSEIRDLIETAPYSAKVRDGMMYALRQIFGSARRAGAQEELSEQSLRTFVVELKLRDISHRTRAADLAHGLRLVRLFSLDREIASALEVEIRAAKRLARREPSVRRANFRASPITPIDLAVAAKLASDEAHTAVQSGKGRQTIHRLFITAGVLAFLSYLPERSKDIQGLRIDGNIYRDAMGWSLAYASHKSAVDRATDRLPEMVTPFLDDLILLGSDPGQNGEILMVLLTERANMRSPLFARTDLVRPYSGTRLFELVKERCGHGLHATRKAMCDHLIELGADKSEVLGQLGHRSIATSENHYSVLGDRIRREKGANALTVERERDALVKFKTPSGRAVDIDAINRSLRQAT